MFRLRLGVLCGLGAAALAACGPTSTGGSDASAEAALDAATDGASDSAPESASDAPNDAPLEAAPDDVAPDALDAALDDAPPEASPDDAPDVPAIDVVPVEAAVVIVTDPCDPRAEDPLAEGFAQGRGTAASPYLVCTPAQLARFAERCNAVTTGPCALHARVGRDLDLAATPVSYVPVRSFSGVFEGARHTIRGLRIDVPATETDDARRRNLGLFGTIVAGGAVRSVKLVDVLVRGYARLGGVAGENSGEVSDCEVSGLIEDTGSGTADSTAGRLGGVVGQNDGEVSFCTSTATIRGGTNVLGGVVGFNGVPGTVSQSHFRGTITLRAGTNAAVGGITANNQGVLTGCSAEGTFELLSPGTIGGLAGNLGNASNTTPAFLSRSTANVRIDGAAGFVGGLVGIMRGSSSTISRCHASGAITNARPSVTTGSLTLYVGGLVGQSSDGAIVQSTATGEVSVAADAMAPALLAVGGLIGRMGNTRVSNSFARNAVTARVGVTETNPMAATPRGVGGFVGTVFGSAGVTAQVPAIERCYATGRVTAGGANVLAGGFVGQHATPALGAVEQSYWDTESSGTTVTMNSTAGTGALGRTTAQLQVATPFSGWDGAGIWQFTAGMYPALR